MHSSRVSSEKDDAITLAIAEMLLSAVTFAERDSAVTKTAEVAHVGMFTVLGKVFTDGSLTAVS
jgi:hypothetical protein